MRRWTALFVFLGLLLVISPEARGAYAPEVDYMERMVAAALSGDREAGRAAQADREEKLAAEGLELPAVDFDELYLLSRLIWAEAGSEWLDERWKMAVGEVVLNRVASPEFPDTLAEVARQPGQYYGSGAYLDSLKPSYACVLAAKKLLEGERVLNQPAVVFQSNGVQGSGVFLELRDSVLGSTYLCFSNHMDLYESNAA